MACGRGISGTYGYDDLNRRQDIKLKTATNGFWGDRFVIQAHELAHESVNKFAGNHLIFVRSRLDYTVASKDLAANRRLEPLLPFLNITTLFTSISVFFMSTLITS